MELSSLLSGAADNLFKFLFIGGVLMFVLSMIYPMQKQQEIDIEIITYNKETELLNNDITMLNNRVVKFQNSSQNKIDTVKKLTKTKKGITNLNKINTLNSRIDILKQTYNNELDQLTKDKLEIDVKNIVLKYNESRIKTLKNHSKSYESYSKWLFRLGILFGSIGLIGWSVSTFYTESYKIQQYRKHKNK